MKSFAEIEAECKKEWEARDEKRIANGEYGKTEIKKLNIQKRDRKPCPKCGTYCFGSC